MHNDPIYVQPQIRGNRGYGNEHGPERASL